MIKLTRQVVTLTLENRQTPKKHRTILVDAWVYDNVLAWHKGIKGQWVLTHLRTGYKIADHHGKYASIRPITKKVAELNWETTNHATLKLLSLQVKLIIRGIE